MHIIEGILSSLLLYTAKYLLGEKDPAPRSLFVMNIRGFVLLLLFKKKQTKNQQQQQKQQTTKTNKQKPKKTHTPTNSTHRLKTFHTEPDRSLDGAVWSE